jgi:hypothetical protein
LVSKVKKNFYSGTGGDPAALVNRPAVGIHSTVAVPETLSA